MDSPLIASDIVICLSYQASDRGQVSFITARLRPKMLIFLRYGLKEEIHFSDALFLESDNCFCLGNITYDWYVHAIAFFSVILMGSTSMHFEQIVDNFITLIVVDEAFFAMPQPFLSS